MGKIISVCGGSGAGKTYLGARLRKYVGDFAPEFLGGKPVGYRLILPWNDKEVLWVECDNFYKKGDELFDWLVEQGKEEQHLIYEGLMVMSQVQAAKLVEEYPDRFYVFHLTTPAGNCMQNVDKRRAVKGGGPLEDHKFTRDNHQKAISYASGMKRHGARLTRAGMTEALPKMVTLLGGNYDEETV